MKKSLLFIWLLPLLIVSIAVTGVKASPTTIGVEPPSIVDPGLGPGSDFTVEIWVRDVVNLAGIDFKLGYDTSVLTADWIEYGGLFGSLWMPLMNETYDNLGYLYCGFMRYPGQPGVTGDGKAAIIHFTVDSMGESALDLYDTLLGDTTPLPQPIIHEALGGFFSNEAFHNIAVTNVTASPTEVEVGEPVTINVTVANEGNYTETFDVTVYADMIAYNYTWDPVGGVTNIWVDVGDEETVGTQTDISLENGTSTILTFTWNTTGVAAGNYTISARASTVPDETDTADNLFVPPRLDTPRLPPPLPAAYSPISVTVTAPPAHDIAITSVTVSPTEVDVGDSVTISVTVANEGNYNETFDVKVYYDTTAIETQTDISLENGTSTILTFTWDTTDVAKGTYTIKAEAILDLDEDTDDNIGEAEVTVREPAQAPNILIFAVIAAVVIVIIAVAVIYIVKIRK